MRPSTIGATFAALGVFLLGAMLGVVFLPFKEVLSLGVWLFLVMAPGQLIGLLGALMVVGWPLRRLPAQCTVPRGTTLALTVMALGCVLLTLSALWLLSRVMPLPVSTSVLREIADMTAPLDRLLLFLAIVVLAPIVEELLLRGVVLRGFVLGWGPAVGVVGTALLFATLHLNVLQGVLGLVTGVVFALTVLRTGSLGATILMHAAINGNTFVAVLLAGPRASDDIPPLPDLGPTLLVGVAGLVLVAAAFRRVPRDPARLAALWGLPADAGTSLAALRECARRLHLGERSSAAPISAPPSAAAPATVEADPALDDRCPQCFELVDLEQERCWFCGTVLAASGGDD